MSVNKRKHNWAIILSVKEANEDNKINLDFSTIKFNIIVTF